MKCQASGVKLGGQGITLMSKMSEADRRINEQIIEEVRCHRWRAMLIEQQIDELWLLDRSNETLAKAQHCLDIDELDYAEGWLRKAELEVIARKRTMKEQTNDAS